MARRAEAIVPGLVGLSLRETEEGITFTLVASNTPLASIDAAQYLDDGPCLAAADTPRDIETSIDDLGSLLAGRSRAASQFPRSNIRTAPRPPGSSHQRRSSRPARQTPHR
jgi:hypothetical protein